MALRRLDHLLLLTDDLEAARAFYCDVLGFEDGPRPPLPFAGHWLYLDGAACVHLAERSGYEAEVARHGLGPKVPVDHLALLGEGYDELAMRLQAAGVEAVPNTLPGGSRQLFFDDPNGVRIEIQVPAE
jgi:catechol 2,3-dioxygenase-like lactoylglutathione lyase family enzyme